MRRTLYGIAIAALAATAAPATADDDAARRAVERFVRLLEAGDADGLAALYHPDAAHRDLASGEFVCGAQALRALFSESLSAGGVGVARVEIASFRLLTPDVALAQLTRSREPRGTPAARPGATRDWPPYTAVLVSLERGRWAVAATRAGGNPDSEASAERR